MGLGLQVAKATENIDGLLTRTQFERPVQGRRSAGGRYGQVVELLEDKTAYT
jgi:hypothetical protein